MSLLESSRNSSLMNYQTKGFQVSPILTVLSSGILAFCLISFFGGEIKPAIIVLSFWIVVLVCISPAVGLVLVFALQIFDLAINPEIGGGYDWISPVRVLSILCILSYIPRYLKSRPSIIANRMSLKFLACYLLFSLIPAAISDYTQLSFLTIVKITVHILLIIVALDLLSSKKKLEQALTIIIFGATLGSLYIMFSSGMQVGEHEARLALSGVGINTLALSLGTFMILTFVLLLIRQSLLTFILSSFGLLVMSLLLFSTGTRAVILTVPLSIIFAALLCYWNRLHKLFFFGSLGLILMGGVFYWASSSGFIEGALHERISTIFSKETYSENIRWHLWGEGIKISLNHPLGVGPGCEAFYYSSETSLEANMLEAHNTFLSILIEYSLVGLLLFLLVLLYISRSLTQIKSIPLRMGTIAILSYSIMNALKGSIQETRLLWHPILFVMLIIEINYRHIYSMESLPDDPAHHESKSRS